MTGLNENAEYVIRIEGCVPEGLTDRVGPVTIESRPNGAALITTLSGIVVDQAALVGLVRYLHGLGVILLSVERKSRD